MQIIKKNLVPDKLSLEGKVVQRAECRPINDKTYMTLKKDSIRRAIQPKKTTITLKAPVNAYKPVANHVANVSFYLPTALSHSEVF